MLKVVGRLDNLRRAPGPSGQLKKISREGGFYIYMREDYGSYFPFPTSECPSQSVLCYLLLMWGGYSDESSLGRRFAAAEVALALSPGTMLYPCSSSWLLLTRQRLMVLFLVTSIVRSPWLESACSI